MAWAKPSMAVISLLMLAGAALASKEEPCAFDAYGQSSVLFGQDYDFVVKVGTCAPSVDTMTASIRSGRETVASTTVDISAASDGYWKGSIAVGEASREWTDGAYLQFCIEYFSSSEETRYPPKCENIKFNARVRSLMVQLIKPLFAPGDLFEAQIVCFGRDLSLCVDAELTCEIVTPGAIVVKRQTIALGTSEGQEVVGSFSFKIDEKPLLGEYTFRCELETGEVYSKTFAIDQYVLPRFSTTANFDAPVLVTSALPSSLTGVCEVEYTFGQKVDAVAAASFFIDDTLVHSEDNLETLEMGRYKFSVPASKFSSIQPKSTLTVICNATEASGAGLYQSGEASISAEQFELVVDCCDSASCSPTVKPDQYCVCMSAKLASGASLAGYAAEHEGLQLSISFSQCGFDTQHQLIPLAQVQPRNELCFHVLYPTLNQQQEPDTVQPELREEIDSAEDGLEVSHILPPVRRECWSAGYELRAEVQATQAEKAETVSNTYTHIPDQFTSDNQVYLQVKVDAANPVMTTGQTGSLVVSRMCDDSSMTSFAYIVRSRGKVQQMGDVAWTSATDLQPFSFPISFEMAPTFDVIVTGVCSNEIMADMITLPIDRDGPIFPSNVEVSVSVPADPGYVLPGETVTLSIDNAPSDAAIGLIGIDQRVLLAAGAQADNIFINAQQIVDALFKFGDADDDGNDDSPGCGRGCFFFWPMPASSSSAADLIEDANLVVLYSVYTLPSGRNNYYYRFGEGAVFFDAAPLPVAREASVTLSKPRVAPRRDFRESIVFSVSRWEEGGEIPVFVGDSITTHEISWFAASPSEGLSAAKDTLKVRVFKPMFAMVHAPYAVVRGESFMLTITVCNYQDASQQTGVTARFNPSHFTKLAEKDGKGSAAASDKGQPNQCGFTADIQPSLCQTFLCPLVANTVGEKPVTVTVRDATGGGGGGGAPIDTIVKQVRGKPEGCPLIIPEVRDKIEEEDDSADNERCFDLVVPASAVPESGSAKLRLYTGLNAPVLENLDNLIMMPFGCGEQTIIILAPMIYLRSNLEATGAELPPGKMDELMNNMNSGYQRELTFRHDGSGGDFGSFSAFGMSDDRGSTWLTAFVTQVFAEANSKGYLAVDVSVLRDAALWLKDTVRTASGRFPEVGNVCHKEMQGGSASGVTLTAFVVRALSTIPQNLFNDLGLEAALSDSIHYVESQIGDVSTELDPYTLGLTCNGVISYHKRIGSSDTQIAAAVRHYVDRLKQLQAVDEADTQCPYAFWAHYNPDTAAAGTSSTCMIEPWHCASTARSIDVETTSYAMMCLLRVEPEYSGIGGGVDWLACKQNGNGGFSSTSDTVAALAALSLYTELNSIDTDMEVRITRDQQNILDAPSVNIVQSNLVHSYELVEIPQEPASPAEVCVRTRGAGRLYVAIDSFRNEPVCPSAGGGGGDEGRKRRAAERALQLVWRETSVSKDRAQFRFCVAYVGDDGEATGMALVEIEPLSGFSFEGAGLTESESVRMFKRQEVTRHGSLALYFDGFVREDICFDVAMARVEMVGTQQAKTIKASLYYDTEVSTTEMYSSEALMNTNVVEACADCDNSRNGINRASLLIAQPLALLLIAIAYM